jgi:hypothetical protein
MSDYEIKVGSTSQRIGVTLADSSSTVGAGLAGLAFGSAGLTCYYWRESDGNVATTAVTLATATKGTFTSSGFIEKDATNMPGHYEVGVPDAAIAAGSKWVRVMFKGATNLAQRTVVIRLLAVDPDNATSMGISRLDVAVSQGPAILVGTAQAGAAGTITLAAGVSSADSNLIGAVVYITSGTGVGQAGRVITAYVQATKVASVSPNWQTTPDNTSVYAVVPTPPAPTASTALPSVNTTQFAGQTVTAAAGVTLPASVASPTNITAASGVTLSSAGVQAVWDALTSALTTVGSVGKRIADFLTGDAYVRDSVRRLAHRLQQTLRRCRPTPRSRRRSSRHSSRIPTQSQPRCPQQRARSRTRSATCSHRSGTRSHRPRPRNCSATTPTRPRSERARCQMTPRYSSKGRTFNASYCAPRSTDGSRTSGAYPSERTARHNAHRPLGRRAREHASWPISHASRPTFCRDEVRRSCPACERPCGAESDAQIASSLRDFPVCCRRARRSGGELPRSVQWRARCSQKRWLHAPRHSRSSLHSGGPPSGCTRSPARVEPPRSIWGFSPLSLPHRVAMAVDTANKRMSVVGFALPFRTVAPIPDGSLAAVADREQVAHSYAGIAASAPAIGVTSSWTRAAVSIGCGL